MSQRVTLTTSDGLSLAALVADGGRGAAVIAPPHPLYGGRMDNPVVEALTRGLAAAGVATLRFDYRGCGESQGVPSDDARQADMDYAAALAELADRWAPPYIAAGYSFGAATALRAAAAHPSVDRVVLIAPPVAMIDRATLERAGVPVHVVVGDDDSYAPLARLERALSGLSNVQRVVLDGTDHFFSAGTEEIAAFAQKLPL